MLQTLTWYDNSNELYFQSHLLEMDVENEGDKFRITVKEENNKALTGFF